MIRPFSVFTALLCALLPWASMAQVAEPLHIPEDLSNQRSACGAAMDAGDRINIIDFNDGSVFPDDQPIVLCFGQSIFINHNDATVDLSGDPDPIPGGTPGGIGYIFYEGPPSSPGPEVRDLLADPNLVTMPRPANGEAWIARGTPDGDVSFVNDGKIQDQFFNGDAGQLWFAAATVTDFGDTASFDDGSCLNVRVDQAFSVVYLNDIQLSGFSTPDASSLSGMFTLTGGLAEFNGSNYSVTLIKDDDPTVVGQIDASIQHNTTTTFTVPEAGVYNLVVADDQGCYKKFIVSVPHFKEPVQVCFGNGTVATGDQICVPVTVSGFKNIILLSIAVKWDPSLFSFTGLTNIASFLGSSVDESFVDNGLLKAIPLNLDDNVGETLADGDTLFEVCLTAIGPPGSNSPFSVATASEGGLDLSFIDTTAATAELPVSTKPGTLTITLPDRPVLNVQACGNGATVDVSISAFGGTAPYRVNIEDVANNVILVDIPSAFSAVTQMLNPGTYTFLVEDATGASSSQQITLSADPITLRYRAKNPSCLGDGDDGGIVIDDITGGSAPYQVTWIGPDFIRFNDDSLRNLTAGDYKIIVTDATGCADTTANIPLASSALAITVDNKTLPACSGSASGGSISVTVTGGSKPNYQYLWMKEGVNGPVRTADGMNPSDMLTGPLVQPGNYYLVVTNYQTVPTIGCSVTDTISLGALKELSLTVNANSSFSTSCGTNADGSIDITAGANMNQSSFTFDWDQNAKNIGLIVHDSQNDNTNISNLPGGTYSITITDADGCMIDTSFVIEEPPALNLDPRLLSDPRYTRQPDCSTGMGGRIDLGFADGVIGGTPFGGNTSPYIYRWYDVSNGNNIPLRGNSALRDLVPGDYGIYVEDANGCSDSTVLTLQSGPSISIQQDQTNICRGDSLAQLSVTGAIAGNSIEWSTGETTESISSLKEGIYWVEITEVTGTDTCVVRDSFVIQDPIVSVRTTPMLFNISSNCNEPNSGFTFNFTTDYPGALSWIWPTLNDTMLNTPVIQIDQNGDYPFVVVDRFTGCIVYDSAVAVQFPDRIEIDIDTLPVSCNGLTDGSIELTVTGRGGMFDVAWPTGVTDLGVSFAALNNLPSGIYQVTVSESSDPTCAVPLEIIIPEPDALTLVVDSSMTDNIRCFGESNGQIGLIWEGGNRDAAPTIIWSDASLPGSLLLTDLTAGTYDVTLTDSRGCQGMQSLSIVEPPELFAMVPIPESPQCNGFQTTVTVDMASGGTGNNYTFSVDNGPTQAIGTLVPVFAGDHTVTVFDEKGCMLANIIDITEPSAIGVELGPDKSVALGDSVSLRPESVISTVPIAGYIWTPSDFLSCSDCVEPFAFPEEDQSFEVTVVDDNGCQGMDQIFINVDKARLVYIPNGFTPDGDGLNDVWQVYTGPGVREIKGTHIFDRWGNLIFQHGSQEPSRTPTEGWNGQTSGQQMDPGVYVYLVEVEFVDGRIFTYRGDVTLVR